MSIDPGTITTLKSVSTATLTTILLKNGLRNVWMRHTRPLAPGQERVVGSAFTMRFIPAREDLATPASWSSPTSTRAAIETMPEGCIVVVDAMGETDCGILGDILCERMARRGVCGLVTDGSIRDVEGISETRLPVWCHGIAAPPAIARLTFVDWQRPIGCGGVAVYPDDIVVADADGAVLIPAAVLGEVLNAAPEQERMEAWTLDEVRHGTALPGLYPMNTEAKLRYETWKKQQ